MRLFDKIKGKFRPSGSAPTVDLQAHEVRVGPHTITPPDGWGMREDEDHEGALFYLLMEGIPEGQEPVIVLWRLPEAASSPDDMLRNFWRLAGSGEWMSKGSVHPREGLTAERYHAQALHPDAGDVWLCTLAIVRVSASETLVLWAAAPRDRWDLVEEPFETALGSLILQDNGVPATEEERRVKVTRFLEKERRSYLRAFEYVMRTQVDEVEGAEGACEPLFRIAADLPQAYALCRPDILVRESGEWQTLFVSKDPLSGFEPVRFKTASGMEIEILAPLAWSRVRLRIFGEVRSWRPFEEWVAAWMKEARGVRVYSLELMGVIHSVKPPEREPACWWTQVDFGSAPADSFWALAEALSESGAQRLEVFSDEPGSEYLEQWEDLRPA